MKTVPVLFLLLVPLLTSCKERLTPADCSDIHQQNKTSFSGVYTIYPLGERSAVQVFQRRMDGTVNFYRPWDYYKFGFGGAAGEYWLGLDNIYYLTNQRKYELLVDMQDFDEKTAFARYSSFSISGECDGYKLNVYGFSDGGAGDAMTFFNGQKFSTFDKDQDSSPNNCAKLHLGAFWYNNCHDANPNGVYLWGADGTITSVGVEWQHWRGVNYSLKSISMKIRPVQ
ncbi:microfibril-associated glycoprotein 4-like isoform X2 [Anabas testudineus]|uniref:Fibrinogen C-terminal domain-containing protein n=1 Tax=Anabas testudineus TaxID=64144 RepID=A0A3Q1IQX0_ANATE|nr:microfibril-associated glycoprotein 4-like isoform X2 [Anabas testudineus]